MKRSTLVVALLVPALTGTPVAAQLDATFGEAGRATLFPGFMVAYDHELFDFDDHAQVKTLSAREPMHITTLPDGSYVVGTSKTLSRVTSAGVVDTAFGYGLSGVAGRCVTFDRCNAVFGPLVVAADGSIYVSMVASTSWERFGPGVFGVVKLKTDGKRDASFGVDGVALLPKEAGTDDIRAIGVMSQSEGKLLVVGSTRVRSTWRYHASAARFLADGRPDESFGPAGRKVLDFGDDEQPAFAAAPEGKFVVAGVERGILPLRDTWPRAFIVARFDAEGVRDPAFTPYRLAQHYPDAAADGWLYEMRRTSPRPRIAVDVDGSVLAISYSIAESVGGEWHQPEIVRLDPAGKPLEHFPMQLAAPAHADVAMTLDPQRRILLSTGVWSSPWSLLHGHMTNLVSRSHAGGWPDPTFAPTGARLLGAGIAVRALHVSPSGDVLVAALANAQDAEGEPSVFQPVLIRLARDDPKGPVWVHEYVQTGNPYFFYTTLREEIDWLAVHRDQWMPAIGGFIAWTEPGEGRIPVCRFLSGPAQLPQFAHFFTADQALCETIKPPNDVWTYEGIPFYVGAVAADGSCPAGLAALRGVRNGITGVPNVRLLHTEGTESAWMPPGWSREGVVGCVPRRP